MSQQSNEQERESQDSPDDHLQAFQKRLVLHVLVMDNYTLVNRRSNRIEFQGALTIDNINTIINAIQDELLDHFKIELACPDCGAKSEDQAQTACNGIDTCPMTCCDDWNKALKIIYAR